MHSTTFTIPFPYYTDTDNHSGSESSSSCGSDDLHQSPVSSASSGVAYPTSSGASLSSHPTATSANNGYYVSSRNTTAAQVNGNGNQVFFFRLNQCLESTLVEGDEQKDRHSGKSTLELMHNTFGTKTFVV